MDVRTDTSSGRFGGQWAYLNNTSHYGHARSLPPSSYLPRTDPSNGSANAPVVSPLYHFNLSRTNLLRTRPTTSTGGQSSVTFPSQPVLVREHSADASSHSRPTPRTRRPDVSMSRSNELPPVSAFSIRGILEAIHEDIEGDINAISEILGRSRLTLADQHESHLPPQGEIRAATMRPLQAVEEASSSNEQLAADNIIILDHDASLVDGSHTGSRAYGLLERLQAMPRTRRQRSDSAAHFAEGSLFSPGIQSSPAVLPDANLAFDFVERQQRLRSSRASRLLLRSASSETPTSAQRSRTTNAVVSETYLSAGANGRTATNPPVVSEAGRLYPLYSYDESELFEQFPEPGSSSRGKSFQSRMQNLRLVNDWQGLTAWLRSDDSSVVQPSAETHLRGILERQSRHPTLPEDLVPDTEEAEIYD